MKWHLLLLAVGVTCHVLTPLCVAATAFLVSLILTWHVPVAVVTAVIALGVASYHARWYSLHAIGPEFIDPDHPVALVCVAKHALRLLLLLLLTPVTVLIVGVALRPFNPYSSIVAMVVGIPTQAVVDFLLRVSANVWTWRVRRGRVISTSREIRGKISAYSKRRRLQPSDLTVWGGRYVPRDLMGAHTKILGMTGSGKTVTLRHILQWLVQLTQPGTNAQLVVFDPKRELYSYIMGMDAAVPVMLFDGTDRRGYAWDMAADITDPNRAKTIANLFVPEELISQPYFQRAGRRILECVIEHVIDHATHWTLQDVFMILDDEPALESILPHRIQRKYFEPHDTLQNTRSTLDTITSRFETLAASWFKAEQEGRSLSLDHFVSSMTPGILVIPRRLDIAYAVDPIIRLVFERLIQLWLARTDNRLLPPDQRPDTQVILDETAKAGKLTQLDDLLLMGRSKGVSVTLAAQDIEGLRHEYGPRVANSLLNQCANTAIFALESPETRDYCAKLFGTYEIWQRPRTSPATSISTALSHDPKDLYQPAHLQEHKTLHPSDPTQLPRAKHTGMLSGYLITDGLGDHYESYRFAESLLPPANIPVLMPRDAEDQKLPESFTAADRLRLGIRQHTAGHAQPGSRRSGDSLRTIRRMNSR